MTRVLIDTNREPWKAWDKEDSREMAAEMRQMILERTAAGRRGIDGAPFKPYSDEYAAEHGSTVDLRVTGDMLGRLIERAAGRRATVLIRRMDDGDMWTELVRSFLSLNESEVDAILTPVVERIFDRHNVEAKARMREVKA